MPKSRQDVSLHGTEFLKNWPLGKVIQFRYRYRLDQDKENTEFHK
jgi:hypothetical protein